MSKLGLWKAIGLLCVLCAATAIVGTFIRFGGPKAQAGWRRHPFVMSAILPGGRLWVSKSRLWSQHESQRVMNRRHAEQRMSALHRRKPKRSPNTARAGCPRSK